MKPWLRGLLIALAVLLVILLVGPFLVPVPPLEGTVPPEQLADPDSRFIVPTQQSVRLAGEIPGAQLVVIPECGHVPQEECPGPFLEAEELLALLDGLA